MDVHLPITWMTSGSCMLLIAIVSQSKGTSLPAGHELAAPPGLHCTSSHASVNLWVDGTVQSTHSSA